MNNYELHRKRITCKNPLCDNHSNRYNCYCKKCANAYVLGYRKAYSVTYYKIRKLRLWLKEQKINNPISIGKNTGGKLK